MPRYYLNTPFSWWLICPRLWKGKENRSAIMNQKFLALHKNKKEYNIMTGLPHVIPYSSNYLTLITKAISEIKNNRSVLTVEWKRKTASLINIHIFRIRAYNQVIYSEARGPSCVAGTGLGVKGRGGEMTLGFLEKQHNNKKWRMAILRREHNEQAIA